MQIKLLKNIVSHISGPASEKIVDLLYGKENVNEFLIAKRLDVTINQARNILYKLGDEGLVSFIRKRDKKNGGWYTYFWTLDVGKGLFSLRKRILAEIDNLQRQLTSKQAKQFYYCSNCDIEISEENALLYNFTCSECGEVFEAKDNKNYIQEVKDRLSCLDKDLEVVDQELAVIKKKEESAKDRKQKSEEKKKKAEREVRRKERQRLKKIEERKAGKGKKPKKKGKGVKKRVKRIRKIKKVKKARGVKKSKKPFVRSKRRPVRRPIRKKKIKKKPVKKQKRGR